MAKRSTAEPGSRPSPSRWPAVVAVAAGAALLVLATVLLWFGSGESAWQALREPERSIPLATSVTMDEGTYVVFQRTGSYSDGTLSVQVNATPTLQPMDVDVLDQDGTELPVVGRTPGYRETLKRDGVVYTDAVAFTVPRHGTYQVLVNASGNGIVVAPSLSWHVGRLLTAGGFVLAGAALLVTGLVLRQRRNRVLQSVLPPPGWYLNPQVPGRWRYWNGRRWTEHVR